MHTRTECARCFRCIVNGGNDPDVLKSDQVEWKSDGFTSQVTDMIFVNTLIRDSGALDSFVAEFLRTVGDTMLEKSSFLKASATLTKFQTRKNVNQNDDSDEEGYTVDEFNANFQTNTSSNNSIKRNLSGNFENDLSSQIEMKKGELGVMQELAYVLLDLCLELSADHKNASAMCSLRVCDGAIDLLRDATQDSPREPRVSVCVEIIWNCLEYYLGQSLNSLSSMTTLTSVDIMDFEKAVSTLKDVLLALLLEGYRLADKEVRNEVVVVLTLIGNFPEAVPYFLQSGLFNVLVTYSCAGEAGRDAWPFFSIPLAKFRNFASAFDVDLQLKRSLWMLISDILKYDDPDVIMCVASSPLISVMLNYLVQNSLQTQGSMAPANDDASDFGAEAPSPLGTNDHPPQSPESALTFRDMNGEGGTGTGKESSAGAKSNEMSNIAPSTQLRELQVLAVKFLAENAHRLMGEFVRVDGPVRILEIIARYGSSPHADHRSIVYNSLLLLNRCLTNCNVVKDKLEQHSAIEVFLQQFEESEDESIRAQAARLISIMCFNSENSQTQLRKLNGISALVKTLTNYADSRRPLVGKKAGIALTADDNELEDPTTVKPGGDISVHLVAVLDCISRAVVSNRKNEARFAQVEGVDGLLDVVEVAPLLIRVQSLRLLSDLLDNQRLVTFALAWRSGKTMRSAGQLLAHAWMEEEVRLINEREKGVICNLWDPLGCHHWPKDNVIPDLSAAALDGLSSSNVSSPSASVQMTSSAVAKLSAMIAANRCGVHAGVQSDVRASLLKLDIRGIIANIMSQLGLLEISSVVSAVMPPSTAGEGLATDDLWEKTPTENGSPGTKSTSLVQNRPDDSLSPMDRQVVSMAARYGVIREGQWWNAIKEELSMEGIVPIEADLSLMLERLENLFEAARAIQFEQMELVAISDRNKHSKEQVFIGQILQQKNQEVKSEWLKRKAQHNKSVQSLKVKL